MRKRVRVARPVSVPMLINRGLQNDDLEMRERAFVLAFQIGAATTEHFDNLADMRDCLMLAAAEKRDDATMAFCRMAGVALMNIRDRYAKTKRMGASGEELKALQVFVTAYRDFWLRQPVSLYEQACSALDRARAMGRLEVEVRA